MNLSKEIFKFAYNAALNDATMQKAYEGTKNTIKNNEKVRDLLKSYIDSIFSDSIRGVDYICQY